MKSEQKRITHEGKQGRHTRYKCNHTSANTQRRSGAHHLLAEGLKAADDLSLRGGLLRLEQRERGGVDALHSLLHFVYKDKGAVAEVLRKGREGRCETR